MMEAQCLVSTCPECPLLHSYLDGVVGDFLLYLQKILGRKHCQASSSMLIAMSVLKRTQAMIESRCCDMTSARLSWHYIVKLQ